MICSGGKKLLVLPMSADIAGALLRSKYPVACFGVPSLSKTRPEGAKFRNTLSACGGDRNFEAFVNLLEYQFSTIEIYTSGCFVSLLARRPHKIALLCNVNDWQDAKLWKIVLVNRFILAQVFRDREDAERWVLG